VATTLKKNAVLFFHPNVEPRLRSFISWLPMMVLSLSLSWPTCSSVKRCLKFGAPPPRLFILSGSKYPSKKINCKERPSLLNILPNYMATRPNFLLICAAYSALPSLAWKKATLPVVRDQLINLFGGPIFQEYCGKVDATVESVVEPEPIVSQEMINCLFH
jgi:hypothetical protein